MSLRVGTISFMTEALDRSASLSPKYSDQGILARVPGQFVAQASKSLPDPYPSGQLTLNGPWPAARMVPTKQVRWTPCQTPSRPAADVTMQS